MSFEVDPEAIRASGESLTATGSDFAARPAAFQQQVAAYDGAWGEDTIGTYIGTAYAAVPGWAFENWQTVADELAAAVSPVWENNQGAATEAFRAGWNGEESSHATLRESAPGAAVVGAGLMACAGIVPAR